MNATNRHNFHDIRVCHYAAHNHEAGKAFDILAPYFPSTNQNTFDLVTIWMNGGTFLSNWNLTVAEATVAVEVIQEMKCASNCFFIVPIPSYMGFPEAHQQKKVHDRLALYSTTEIANIDKFINPFPPYFAIHSYSTNIGCIKTLKELALTKLMEAAPTKELKQLKRLTEFHTSILLSNYTLGGDKSE